MRIAAIALVSLSAFAQTTTSISASSSANQLTIGFAGGRMMPPGVTGKPYSARQVTETVQTLADGTHIRQQQRSTTTYRDSLGRTRTEQNFPTRPGGSAGTYARITDPVGGYEYVIDDVNKVVHRMAVEVMQPMQRAATRPTPRQAVGGTMAAPPAGVASGVVGVPAGVVGALTAIPSVAPTVPKNDFQSEDLGTQAIGGVTAHGRRTTTTWPVDSVGNDRPIVFTNEIWISDQVGMPVLTKSSDPRYGETTTTLEDLSVAEPDPSLFMPPPGYQIVDETGPFKISMPIAHN